MRRTTVVRRRAEVREPVDELMRDAATGLVPRVAFSARLQEQLALGHEVGIVAVGTEWVAGEVGSAVADATLTTMMAKRLTSGLRNSDLVASFGGDGFAVMVLDAPAPQVLHAIARRLVAAVSGPVALMAEQLEVRASAAFAMVLGADLRGEHVVAQAIRARQRALALSGDRVLSFDPYAEETAVDTVVWSPDELERALQAGEFEAWFQPVVDVATADLAGFEAFMRWSHPDLGVLEPAQFIDAAEDAGLLGRIGTEVMRQALRQLSRWDVRVPERALTMAVNLSSRQLGLPDLADTIRDLVAAGGLPADRMRVDVAQQIVASDPDAVAVHVAALQRQGVLVCLDDFGAGSASMALSQRVPFDVVKLDRQVLDGVDAEAAQVVLDALVRFGHSVGLTVVAEGVESPRELAALRRAGCDQAQGRLFSGARQAHEIDTMLDRWLGMAADGRGAA